MAKGWERRGNSYKFISVDQTALHPKLPAGIYNVEYNMFTGYYFDKIKDCFEDEKLYGNSEKRATKILTSYQSRTKATGAIFVGNKGSGKTAITKLIANKAIRELGLPVITCSSPHCGDAFNEFIANVGECVLIFDEFAKVYKDDQQQLLTLLDGTMSTKRLCLFTENTVGSLNEYIKERPGRAFYLFQYNKLDADVVKEYCEAHLIPERLSIIPDIVLYSTVVYNFSFDILNAIIEECNRFPDESFDELCKDLNIEAPTKLTTVYELQNVKVCKDDKEYSFITNASVLRDSQYLYVYPELPDSVIEEFDNRGDKFSDAGTFLRRTLNNLKPAILERVPADKKAEVERWSLSNIVDNYGSDTDKEIYKAIHKSLDYSISFDMSDTMCIKTDTDGTKTYVYSESGFDMLLKVKEYKEAPTYYRYV